ncbi:MAG: sugar O-acetyltransferase [Bacteroidaceae bacterium]|nr:sugar O-acetyltransferase [Bacteroidaceae bacterium]
MSLEWQKMLHGELYDANNDVALIAERNACKVLCQKYNTMPYEAVEERKAILRDIIGSAKGDFIIEPSFWCDYGCNIFLGENFYANHNLVILDAAPVVFGDNVFVAPNCCFTTAVHPIDVEQRNKGLEYAHPITVGNNVWIGAGVAVLPGVTIGDNVTIGAGSLVNRDIPSDSVAVGVPCRVIKQTKQE